MIEGRSFEKPESGAGFGWIINHLPAILWQRRLYVIGAFLFVFLAGVITAFSLPTMYRSSATLLIQNQQLSSDVVESPGSGEIEQRIARIRERVLSRGDLISLIEQYGLYPDERRSNPMSYVVDKMRKATTVGALEAGVGQSSGQEQNLIAITMSFDYPEPALAQQVLQSYVTRFLRMDNESVEDQANLTVRFLEDQAGKLHAQVTQIERQITELKARNGSALASPGGMPFMDTGSYTAQIAALENQNRQLLLQSRRTGSGGLAEAEADLAKLRSVYADSHPDVMMARERVETLRNMPAGETGGETMEAIRDQIRANNETIAQLNAAKSSALARASSAMAGQARAPAILEQAMQLESRAGALREQYNKVSNDLLRAQNSARLANEQRAERLSLVEPPNLPDRPHWPNRPLFIAAAAAAGLGLGLFLALGIELLSRPMRSPTQLQGMGLPVLGVVPILRSENGRRSRFRLFRRREKSFA